MIKKIKEIKNIGRFSDFTTGGELGFEKLTFIYGLNTYGKTTLTDIFQSLKDNNPTIISDRKTIPLNEKEQKIQLVIQDDGKQKNIIFQNNIWNKNNLSLQLEIFGTEFIHKNLFTGLLIERSNKENFTDFILGEEAVILTNKIKENNKDLGKKKTELKNINLGLSNDKEKQKFVDFQFAENLETIRIQLDKLQEKKRQESDKNSRLNEIKTFKKINLINWTIDVLQNLDKLNQCLREDYKTISDEIVKQFNEHIEKHVKNEHAERWIKHGLKIKKTEHCPFCGQTLQAAAIIDIYQKYFNEAYLKFIEEIEKNTKEISDQIKNTSFNIKTKIQTELQNISDYQIIVQSPLLGKEIQVFKEKIEQLNEDILETHKQDLLKIIENRIEEKNKKPHVAIEVIDYTAFEKTLKEYEQIVKDIDNLISLINGVVLEIKEKYENQKQVTDIIEKIDEEIKSWTYKKLRLEKNQDCENYKHTKEEIKKLETSIKEDENNLNTTQSEYLKTYFEKIDELFAKFGSRNFKLEQIISDTGHKPVYSLKVKFHNKDIENAQMKSVFSESDRRALALAIFWAKIELKSETEKAQTIVVLDDPMTSFDDNRITNTINLFTNGLVQLKQIIVLTHYPHFIKRFYEIPKANSIPTQFLEIKNDSKTNSLALGKKENFISNDYEKIFTKIMGYINGDHKECIKRDLRPFLEDLYLPTVFAKQLDEAKKNNRDISSLEKIIKVLFDGKEKIKSQFHEFRTTLNPDSHIFTSNNTEDVVNFAKDMMNFLYSFKFDNQQPPPKL